jgi:hypothetical protein
LYSVTINYKDGACCTRWFSTRAEADAFVAQINEAYGNRASPPSAHRICTSKRPVRNSDVVAWLQSREKLA